MNDIALRDIVSRIRLKDNLGVRRAVSHHTAKSYGVINSCTSERYPARSVLFTISLQRAECTYEHVWYAVAASGESRRAEGSRPSRKKCMMLD